MRKFEFTLVVDGIDLDDDDFENRFFEVGCDDATMSVNRGVVLFDFIREEKNLIQALTSAIRNVRQGGAEVVAIEPAGLVSVSEIADRGALSRQAVHQYAIGKRKTDFPSPLTRLTSGSPLYSWYQVAHWLEANNVGDVDRYEIVQARMVESINEGIASKIQSGQIAIAHHGSDLRARKFPIGVLYDDSETESDDVIVGTFSSTALASESMGWVFVTDETDQHGYSYSAPSLTHDVSHFSQSRSPTLVQPRLKVLDA